MIDIFINPNDGVDLHIAIAVKNERDEDGVSNSQIVADLDIAKLKELYGAVEQAEEHTLSFRIPDFGDQQRITGDALKIESNALQLNIYTMRLNMIKTLIKKWSFKDKNGKAIEPSGENIEKLHPVIANLIGLELEKELQSRSLM